AYTGVDNSTEDLSANLGFKNYQPLIDQKEIVVVWEGVTATRNRNRGIWLRPGFNHIDHAKLAMNRHSASLVSSGGAEGSSPGIWGLLSNSIFVGISTNNVARFGPCKGEDICFALPVFGSGYPGKTKNMFGYLFYDGPARLERNHFINFNQDLGVLKSLLTEEDFALIDTAKGGTLYEGDAALGWFDANANAYPPTQYTKELLWTNTDFRHQVFTEHTNSGNFLDGDKNTAILDLDGTLSGFMVVTSDKGDRIPDRYPISLNNLPFLGSPLTVDEPLSIGNLNKKNTGRSTSLMSPHDYATLEAVIFDPQGGNSHKVTFTKNQMDYDQHQSMTLEGRNKTGVFEPKVMDKLGYTITSTKGIPPYISFSLVDVAKPEIEKEPFKFTVGICYNSEGGTAPNPDSFVVQRGFKSIGS
ncbi:MAG: hypothetical protein KDD63_23445, partial [Bacteroidetes bacterium]|nr:hypothetical protein [Bacteroidota bacterium]